MIFVTGNIEGAIRAFKHEILKSGLSTSLKLRKIAKKSERKKVKAQIALKRKLVHQKRRDFYRHEEGKG
jgi:ribosomal protein S21